MNQLNRMKEATKVNEGVNWMKESTKTELRSQLRTEWKNQLKLDFFLCHYVYI